MKNDPADNLIEVIGNESVFAVGEELLDYSFDQIVNNDTAEHLPVVGGLIATGKLIFGIREYIFSRKVIAFILNIKSVDFSKREKFYKQLQKSKMRQKVGLQLIAYIDKADTEYKSALLGRLLALHMTDEIPYKVFMRLCEMTINAYSSDLEYFANTPADKIDETSAEVEHLIALGFYERPLKRFGDTIMQGVQPAISKHGLLVQKSLKLIIV